MSLLHNNIASSLISLKGEFDVIAFFVRSYLVKHKLIGPEVAMSRDLIQRPKIRESDLLANPAFNEEDFQLFIRHIRAWIPGFDPLKPKSYYFRKLFYEWVLVAKNTGARPEELMKLRWRDIEHQDVRRDSETTRQENIAHLLQQGIHYSTLTAFKTYDAVVAFVAFKAYDELKAYEEDNA